jgi:hypothetical protein
VLQICYSSERGPYLTRLSPIIPSPELRGDGYISVRQIKADIPPQKNPQVGFGASFETPTASSPVDTANTTRFRPMALAE